MTVADRIRIAVAQTDVTTDPEQNGAAVRAAMRQAAAGGARLIHLAEGAISGYAGADKAHYAGWQIDWAPVTEQLHRTMARTDPALDTALHKARPWRNRTRAGDIYAARRVTDPRSTDRTCT